MPWNGSGVFSRLYSWVVDRDNGVNIMASRMDADTDDVAQGLMNCLTIDGQTVPVANLPMRGFRHTGAGDGAAPGDYATVRQLTNGSFAANFSSLTLPGTLAVAGASTLGAVTANSLAVSQRLTTAELTVTDRAAILELDLGQSQSVRQGWFDGTNGNGALAGNLNIGGTLAVGGNRLNVVGNSSPSLGLFNTAGGGPYAVFNSGGYLGLGPCDGFGVPTAFFMWFAGDGNIGVAHDLTVNGTGRFGGLVCSDRLYSNGGDGGYTFDDRVAPGQQWVLYATNGAAALWFGGDRIRVSAAGDLNVLEDCTIGRNLQVNGNANISNMLTTLNLTVNGTANIYTASILNTSIANLTVTNNLVVPAGGPPAQMGALTLAGPLTVNYPGTSEITGALQVDGALDVGQQALFHQGFVSVGAATFEGGVTMMNNLSVNGVVQMSQNLTVQGTIYYGFLSPISDRRLKRNVARLRFGLDALRRLEPVSFEYNGAGGTRADGRAHYGLIADDVAAVLPELAGERPAGPDGTAWQTYDAGSLLAVLVNAAQELAARLDRAGL